MLLHLNILQMIYTPLVIRIYIGNAYDKAKNLKTMIVNYKKMKINM